MNNLLYIVLFCFFLFACSEKQKEIKPFSALSEKHTGVDFVNHVENNELVNIFSYRNFYNGGGIGIGDINNDGLQDLYFTANQGKNALYLNKGGFKFENITEKAGVGSDNQWGTGVSMVDINNDGFLDIYVSNAGYHKDQLPHNQLFINNGDLTFTESAKVYGLDDLGYSTHAAFFDYDLDGDLDVYILNNSFIPVNTLNYANKRGLRAKDWPVADFLKGGGDKLLQNNDGIFSDVSEETGIYGSLIGFGLGVTVGDINNDLLPDIYVSNDFFERDYLYINRGDGTFSEELEQRMDHISLSSMGADLADMDNDGASEIFVTDMLPDEEYRLKTTTNFEKIDVFNFKKAQGFYNQYTQNTFQKNNGKGQFQEISNYAGVDATDWSWGALMFDADNDGLQDIFVCNGIYQDVIDQDFIDFFANEVYQRMAMSGQKTAVDSVISKMPSVPIRNSFFKNEGNFQFSEQNVSFGFEEKTFSNGGAYGDLDNDGDLDLVINNLNQKALIYQNNTSKQNWLSLQIKGSSNNLDAIGTRVFAYTNGMVMNRELVPTRGFQSSVTHRLHFGFKDQKIDSLVIFWPSLEKTVIASPPTDTLLQVEYQLVDKETIKRKLDSTLQKTTLKQMEQQPFDHNEDSYIDFYQERNIPMGLSQEGPKVAVGDVNGDGIKDFFICGAVDQAGQIFISVNDSYRKISSADFEQSKHFEDTAATFFDADGDGDLDLFVGSGGNHLPQGNLIYEDRLYLNDGKGSFTFKPQAFPKNGWNTSVAIPFDFDNDNDIDLFIGSRSVPQNYGLSPQSYIYENDGKGTFNDVTKAVAKGLSRIGMVTDGFVADINGDSNQELIVIGEWMSPTIYTFKNGYGEEVESNLSNHFGWWYYVDVGDLDADGDLDIILGNRGENAYFTASEENPLKLWIKDFDENRSFEKIITHSLEGKDYPLYSKKDLTEQLVKLRKQNLKHSQYAGKTIQDLLGEEALQDAVLKTVNNFESIIAINDGDFNFTIQNLPAEIQLSSVCAGAIVDVNEDQLPDLILGGNHFNYIPQFSRLDASKGHLLINKGSAVFDYVNNKESGIYVRGQIRDVQLVNKHILVAVNNQPVQIYQVNLQN